MRGNTGRNPFAAVQRSALRASLQPLGWGATMGRMATAGTVATIEGQATAVRQGTELIRQTLLGMLAVHTQTVPGATTTDEQLRRSIEEAMDALEESGSESLRALAADLQTGTERAAETSETQRQLAYATAAALLDIREPTDTDTETIRVEVKSN